MITHLSIHVVTRESLQFEAYITVVLCILSRSLSKLVEHHNALTITQSGDGTIFLKSANRTLYDYGYALNAAELVFQFIA